MIPAHYMRDGRPSVRRFIKMPSRRTTETRVSEIEPGSNLARPADLFKFFQFLDVAVVKRRHCLASTSILANIAEECQPL